MILSLTFSSLHSEYLPSHWVLPWSTPAPIFPSLSSICRAHTSPDLAAASTAAREEEHDGEETVSDSELHARSELRMVILADAAGNKWICFSRNI